MTVPTLKLQRQAMKFAEQYLPKENRSEFSRAIMRLQEHSSRVTPTYPEGKRGAEFQNILKEITSRSGEIRKENSLANLKAMAYAVRVKRNWKGIVTSMIPSVQQQVDRIVKVLDMNLATINNLIEHNSEQITLLESG